MAYEKNDWLHHQIWPVVAYELSICLVCLDVSGVEFNLGLSILNKQCLSAAIHWQNNNS